jgi:hypothetical protein
MSLGGGYLSDSGAGVSVGPGRTDVGVGWSTVDVDSTTTLEVAAARFVGVAEALLDCVALAAGGGVWLGSSPDRLAGADVAVTTMIHGVCVGGTFVGSGVTPQPPSELVNRPATTSNPANPFIA